MTTNLPLIGSQAGSGAELRRGLVESYVVNERMNQIVLEHLAPAAWRAKSPGKSHRDAPSGPLPRRTYRPETSSSGTPLSIPDQT